MAYVIGVDLGTSAVKVLLVNRAGDIVHEVSRPYPLIHEKAGYSEQDPDEWVNQTIQALKELVQQIGGEVSQVEGMSFSGQMHGLVLVGSDNKPLRPAILWNDTRTSAQCKQIYETAGKDTVHRLTKNPALEGFTLPKLLWVREHEPELYEQAAVFMLPKDYLRLHLTGECHTDFSDAGGTLLLDVENKQWSEEMCRLFAIKPSLCPPLVEASAEVGRLKEAVCRETGLPSTLKVFAGGADNACGAIGAGILDETKTLVSIGTSGVVLSYEEAGNKDFAGKVHYFNHGAPDVYYTMGVTLAAGHSLSWFKETFASDESFESLLAEAEAVSPGANGLLFTPYLSGERTPHADAMIRASFIGASPTHQRGHFVRAVLEGITFSLKESLDLFRQQGKEIKTIVSIGGAVKSPLWLQLQADVFQAEIVKLKGDQGPGMGAAMLAAYGSGWFQSLAECADAFLTVDQVYQPNVDRGATYEGLFSIYQDVYSATAGLSKRLAAFR
ncbi:xylulokinase [Alkalihalobacillus xiaoxiensis]|uniref:Xylulose kinase n=1 Tax=Shouchella xiaoxiensis TaxID=766895 RepID=A0ABS2SVX7_9BACI|nr:xylulokinase [Shouchella xiaoxiensis]